MVERELDFRRFAAHFRPFVGPFGVARTLEREWDFYLDEPRWTWWRSELGCLAWLGGGSDLDRVTANGGREDDELKAEMTALFESFERYSLACVRPVKTGVWGGLDSGDIDPTHFEYLPERSGTRAERVGWCSAVDLGTGETVYVPESHVRIPFFGRDSTPLVRDPITTGAASGLSRRAAIVRGALEVCERHAAMSCYFGVASAEAIPPHIAGPQTDHLVQDCARYSLNVELYSVAVDLNCAAVIAIVSDPSNEIAFTIGTSAKLALDDACVSAIKEAVFHRRTLRRTWSRVPRIEDGTSIDCLSARSAYWARSRTLEDLRRTLDLDETPVSSSIRRTHTSDEFIAGLCGASPVYVADVTAPELADAGVVVVKVLAPALQPMYLNEEFAGMVQAIVDRGGSFPTYPHPFL